jgi:hypothetical protein
LKARTPRERRANAAKRKTKKNPEFLRAAHFQITAGFQLQK